MALQTSSESEPVMPLIPNVNSNMAARRDTHKYASIWFWRRRRSFLSKKIESYEK